tara:strand:- start:168 stop:995 length:828 start_codon:yes stop_codon:yes gene_type:complete
MSKNKLAILGGGNIGIAIARGLVKAKVREPSQIIITRRRVDSLNFLEEEGFIISSDNGKAVNESKVVILAVRPLQIPKLIEEIKSSLNLALHIVMSVASGVSIAEIQDLVGSKISVVRVMPNTATEVCESMTCLAVDNKDPRSKQSIQQATEIFECVGKTILIPEDQVTPATALCACGTAFFLRAIRAASQGGIQIGFHSDEALRMAAQTAKGAAELLLKTGSHPEDQIDKVTTPRGCTIAGLNEMEHKGFSSALIQGFVKSANIAGNLYQDDDK